MDGDHYIVSFAKWLRAHEARLAQGNVLSLLQQQRKASASWLPASLSGAERAIMLRLDAYHLSYLLVRFEEAGLTIGASLDIPFDDTPTRPLSLSNVLPAAQTNQAETKSFISTSLSWFSTSEVKPASRNQVALELKYLYSCFTKLPSLHLSPFPKAPFQKQIEGFELAADSVSFIPLYIFRNLTNLIIDDLDPRIFLAWDALADSLVSLEIRNTGLEEVQDLLVDRTIRDEARKKGARSESAPLTVRSTLPASKWYSIKRLSLASNFLTAISSTPWEAAFSNVVHLDLSSNLLVNIPSGLSHLVSLRSLNLSDNMIDTLLSAPANIGAITTLNLSKNRLASLCGLERLLNLQSIDVTHNRLIEVDEVGRLAVLPHLRLLYVGEGNHFTGFAEWRVRLFALFAAEDNAKIEIDGSLPSWSESRRIASQSARKTVYRKKTHHTRASITDLPSSVTAKVVVPKHQPSAAVSQPTQVRKPKRIVHLGNGVPPSSTTYQTDAASPSSLRSHEDKSDSQDPAHSRHQRSVTDAASPSLMEETGSPKVATLGRHSLKVKKRGTILVSAAQDSESDSEAFRKRIEALRSEVGENWLRVYEAEQTAKNKS